MQKIRKILTLITALCLVSFISMVAFGCGTSAQNITFYGIKCQLNGDEIIGECTVDFYNDTENAFDKLKFNLFANAFRKDAKNKPILEQYKTRAYPNGESYGEMEIKEVFLGERKLEFIIEGEDKNILTVNLLEPCFPEERVKVKVCYKIKLANVIARTGVNDSTINLANFYPILCGIEKDAFYECVYYSIGDPYYSDCANYKVEFKCDKKYVVASSGKEVSTSEVDGVKTCVYQLNNARSFAIVLSEKFQVKSCEYDGVNILYYYYDDNSPDASLEVAKESIDYFSKTFGKYPYKTYSVVQTKFVQGGMEFPALVMISDDLSEKENIEVIVHETAHEWWSIGVGNNEIRYGFLDEGLAEYSVVLFYENHAKYGLTRENMVQSAERTFKAFCSVLDHLHKKVDTSMLRALNEYQTEYEYVNIAYIKPVIMYDTLRKTVGEKKFFSALKNYYEKYQFKNATPDDLVGVFEKTGCATNGYFRSFFDGKALI